MVRTLSWGLIQIALVGLPGIEIPLPMAANVAAGEAAGGVRKVAQRRKVSGDAKQEVLVVFTPSGKRGRFPFSTPVVPPEYSSALI